MAGGAPSASPASVRGRRGVPAAVLFLSVVVGLLGASLPGIEACYEYNKAAYFNYLDGRNYTLYGSSYITPDCVNNFTTAKGICQQDGLELAPQAEKESRYSLRKLCAVDKRVTCWLDGATTTPGLCFLISQEGDIHEQGCEQHVRFVCRTRESIIPLQVITESSELYDYRMYTTDAYLVLSYNDAAMFCDGLGAGWDLVPYWENNSNAVQQLCSYHGFTCWMKRRPETDGSLCPLLAVDMSLQMQGCQQKTRFVCRRPRDV